MSISVSIRTRRVSGTSAIRYLSRSGPIPITAVARGRKAPIADKGSAGGQQLGTS